MTLHMGRDTTSTAALHGKRLKGRLSSQVPFLFYVFCLLLSFLQCCSTIIIIINTMSSSLASSLCCIGCNALHTLDTTLKTFSVVVVYEMKHLTLPLGVILDFSA